MSELPGRTEVLVVGAGPVGLAVAASLAGHGHDVTVEEVEEVLFDPGSEKTFSRSSGYPMVFGWTSTGKYITVVYEEVMKDPLIVRPVTAYPVDPP